MTRLEQNPDGLYLVAPQAVMTLVLSRVGPIHIYIIIYIYLYIYIYTYKVWYNPLTGVAQGVFQLGKELGGFEVSGDQRTTKIKNLLD